MGLSRKKAKSRSDADNSFGALPRIVWEHADYCNLSGNAAKLLIDLACQFKGNNNGDLTVAYSVLRKRGWRSKGTITRATQELLAANLILCTREGLFIKPGGRCALYALVWKPINECSGKGLNVAPTSISPRKFSLENIKTPGPELGQGTVHKRARQRPRDDKGKYLSVHKQDRLRVVA